MLDQVGDGADLQAVLGGEQLQVGQARHGAVVLHDLADHGGGRSAGHRGQVAAGFGMAGAHQHAAVDRLQREDVAGLDQVAAASRCGATAACTVRARSAAEMPVVTPSAASIETVKAVPMLGAVARHHGRQLQPLAASRA